MAQTQRPDVRSISPQGHVRILTRRSKSGKLRFRARTVAENHERTMVSDQPLDSHDAVITNIISVMQTFGGQRCLVEDLSNRDGIANWYWLNTDGTREAIPFQETDTEKY